jgi:hypothetical protein
MAIGPVRPTTTPHGVAVRAGVAVCALVLVTLVLWAIGLDAVAAAFGVTAFAVGAAAAGADSRRAGDWTPAPRR